METKCTKDEGKPRGHVSPSSIAEVLGTWGIQIQGFQTLEFQVLSAGFDLMGHARQLLRISSSKW